MIILSENLLICQGSQRNGHFRKISNSLIQELSDSSYLLKKLKFENKIQVNAKTPHHHRREAADH